MVTPGHRAYSPWESTGRHGGARRHGGALGGSAGGSGGTTGSVHALVGGHGAGTGPVVRPGPMRRTTTRAARGVAVLGLSVLGLAVLGLALPRAAHAAQDEPYIVTRFSDPALAESSGLVESARHRRLLWTVADSGGEPAVLGVRRGRVVADVRVAGVRNVDWEALAPGPDGTLWVADSGDNDAERSSIALHVIREPTRIDPDRVERTARPRTYRLRYPDGPHDAEALLVHPRDGSVLLVTKQVFGAAFYRATELSEDGTTELRRVAAAPVLVTDGAYSPDGAHLALRSYTSATVYDEPGGPGVRVRLPRQPQGESLAWSPGGRSLLAGSEGEDSAVWRVPLPAELQPGAAPPPEPPAESAPPPAADPADPAGVQPALGGGLARTAVLVAAGLLGLLVLLGVAAYTSSRRHRGG